MTLAIVLESRLTLLAGAALVDRFLGEPPGALHPVVWIGRVAQTAERWVWRWRWRWMTGGHRRSAAVGQLGAGVAIALVVPALFAGGVALILRAAAPWPWLAAILGIALLKSTFALRALGAAARQVATSLARGDLDQARRDLGSLCSRDAAALSHSAVVAGAVESLAENASDSVIAPLFYFALLGVPGAMFYRAVNTLDAMIGYHGRHEYLGKASARLDDLLNLIPARLTAALLLIGGRATGGDVASGWRILRRDGDATESPNAGRPMAAMAGLLGVSLEKPGHYRLGDGVSPLQPDTIAAAWRIVVVASTLAFVVIFLATFFAPLVALTLRGHHGG